MIFSYNWLQSFFDKKLPSPEKLAELLTMRSFQVESVEKKGPDWVLDIDILPNRAGDCFSHIGVARECGALAKLKMKSEKCKTTKKNEKLKSKSLVEVRVESSDDCPRYTAKVIENIKVGESPKWIKERLIACGLRPINNVVDATNYVMLETGQPMHAFDFGKIKSVNPKSHIRTILVRRAKQKEKITTLDGQRCALDENVLVIADVAGPIAIAGIKGGQGPEIDRKTKTVVLEAANFNKTLIRKTSQRLGLRTDASVRFEHGIDANATQPAIERVASLIQEIAGGQAARGIVDRYPKKVLAKKVTLDVNYLNRLLGVNIPKQEVIKILRSLGLELQVTRLQRLRPARQPDVSRGGGRSRCGQADYKLQVTVPTFRLDLVTAEDLVEEVGRIYGYEKIRAEFPRTALVPPERNENLLWEDMLKNGLRAMGFCELYNYSFIGEGEGDIFDYQKRELAEVQNPVSAKQKYLRPTLLINLLKNCRDNFRYYGKMNTFENGKIFFLDTQGGLQEKKMLSGLMADEALKGDELFYRLKGVVDELLNGLGLSNVWYDEYQANPEDSKTGLWHSKKCAEIKIDNDEVGFMGEISFRVLNELKIPSRVLMFDLDFEKLAGLSSEEHEYRPLSAFPSAVRDLAILVPGRVLVEEVLNKIETAGGVLVRDIDLFDIYEGEELPEGKKNLAFHIIFQAEDRTLTSQEIDKLMAKIMKALEAELEWEVRR